MRLFYRGGNYNDNDNAGVFYYNGNNARSNANYNLGFRSALPPSQILKAQGLSFSAEVIKGFISSVTTMAEKCQLQIPVFRLFGTALVKCSL